MKAAILEGIGQLTLKQVDRPEVHNGGLLLQVNACGICGSDLAALRNGDPFLTFPQIIGHELSGTVIAVGDGVSRFAPCNRVTVSPALACGKCTYCRKGFTNMCEHSLAISSHLPGGFAEYMEIPERFVNGGNVFKIPDNVSDEAAALTELIACAINGQDQGRIDKGDIVLVIGAGPTGCLHCELARARGAAKVILSDVLEGRLKMASVFGVDAFINADKDDFLERLLEETDGIGADVVIVTAPSAKAYEVGIKAVRKRGRIVFFAGLSSLGGNNIVSWDSRLIHYRELSLSGACGSTATQHGQALDLLENGKINTSALISHQFSLKDIAKGFEIAESRKAMKVIIRPDWK